MKSDDWYVYGVVQFVSKSRKSAFVRWPKANNPRLHADYTGYCRINLLEKVDESK